MYSDQILSRRDFIKKIGLLGVAVVGGTVAARFYKPAQQMGILQKSKTFEVIDGPMDDLLDTYWNNIASDNPDALDTNIVFLRTSPNPNEPVNREMIISQKQLVFIPWRTAQYDKDDGIPKEQWIDAAWKDMRAGDQPNEANLTIDGERVMPLFSQPHFTSTIVSANTKIGQKLVVPFKRPLLDENRESVTTGYGVLVRLEKGQHRIASSFQGSNNYISSGRWSIEVV